MPRGGARLAGTGLVLLALVLLLAALAVPAGGVGGDPVSGAAGPAQVAPSGRISLASQTPWTEPGGTFELQVDLAGVRRPEALTLAVSVHEAVTSRSQFRQTLDGRMLGQELWRAGPTPLAELELDDGAVRVVVPVGTDRAAIDPSTPQADDPPTLVLTRAGVHPVQVELRDTEADSVVDRFSTHLVRSREDGAPPLAVAWVQPVAAPLALQPDGSVVLDDTDRAALATTTTALASGDTPLTAVPRPETIDVLARAGPEILAQLATALAGRQVVAGPYVDIDPAALLAAGLGDVVQDQRDRGETAVESALGPADGGTWVSERPIDAASLALASGIERLVLPEAALAPIDRSLTLANPFLVEDAGGRRVEAAVVDPELQAHFGDGDDPVLSAHQLLADLAVLAYDSPGLQRGVVIQPPSGWTPEADLLTTAMDALGSGSVVRPVTLDELFDGVPRASSAGGDELIRTLAPLPAPPFDDAIEANAQREVRADLASFMAMVDPAGASAGADLAQRLLLVSSAAALSDPRRSAYLDGTRGVIAERLDAVGILSEGSFRLTSREATIPLTLVSELDTGADVTLVLESDKLDFVGPERAGTGRAVIPLRLGPGRTPVMVPVVARTSGDFPLHIEMRSPDGRLEVASTSLTVRSTSLSGVGILVSAGAGLFLCTWWARHWRSVRRDRRLVDDLNDPADLP
jgi:hypothetical protein